MIEWFDKATDNPWAFIALGIAWVAWRVGKALSAYLADYINQIQKDSQGMKAAIVDMGKVNGTSMSDLRKDLNNGLQENREAVESLERQLVNAIQAAPDDEELFEVLFTNNPTPICFVGSNNKFTKINKACEELWGYSAGELSLMTFADITAGDDIQPDIDNVDRVKAGVLQRYRMQKKYNCKDGRRIECALYVFRYPSNGSFLHFISIIIPL